MRAVVRVRASLYAPPHLSGLPRWRRRDQERWKMFVLLETTHGLSPLLSRRRHLPTVLVRVQPGVIPLAGEQLRMRPVFDNAPLLDHQNGVR